jgi:hypothetical protein
MRTVLLCCALATTLGVSGCRLMNEEAMVQGQSPLRPANPSPDSVMLEVIWVRFPADDPELNDQMWSEIDETQIEPSAHLALARNGFRVGVIAGTPPDAISRALGGDAYRAMQEPTVADGAVDAADLMTEPKVQGRLMQVRRDRRAEIQASDVIESVPLLVSRGRELGGRTYRDAQAIYGLKVDPQPDQTVLVELTPELHYGKPRVRWTSGDEGFLRQLPMRDREVFDTMRMNVRLAPGEMLVLMSTPDSASRLGHYFHTAEGTRGHQQKLVLVRLAQVPKSDAFESVAAF